MIPTAAIPSIFNDQSPDMLSDSTVSHSHSFWKHITGKANRKIILIAILGTVIQFTGFKLLYPFPDFFSDSYSYIFAAYAGLDVSIWPIGYSKFLLAFHNLTHSHLALIAFQYFFLEVTAMYLFLTVTYFFPIRKLARRIIFIFLFFNPLTLYICNYVNSDPLFAAFSIIWFTTLIWTMNKPRWQVLIVSGVALFLSFTIRNNAYYYPILTIAAFLMSRTKWTFRLAGIFLPLILIGVFVIKTRAAAYELTGTKQFSLFTGWQLANNALYMYDKIKVDSTKFETSDLRSLNSYSQTFYSHVKPNFHKGLGYYVGNYFIRQPDAPLKEFMTKHYEMKTDLDIVRSWGQASAVFEKYGKTLIKENPLAYIRYFVLLNTKYYFFAPLEKLEIYNLGEDRVDAIAQYWFDLESPVIHSVSKHVQRFALFVFPGFFFLVNLYLAFTLVPLLVGKKLKYIPIESRKLYGISMLLLLANFGFCITATIIVFRYQFFPLLIFFVLSVLMMDSLDKLPKNNLQHANADKR